MLSRKWATGIAGGGDPSGTGTPVVTDPNAERETLRVEVERLKGVVEQGKAEKSSLEEARAGLDQANARIAELESNAQPPTGATSANPAQRLMTEIGWYQQRIANNQYDFEAERMLRLATAELQGMQWQAHRERELPKLSKVPEKFRAQTQQIFDTGRFLTMEDAAIAAQGVVLSQESTAGAADSARRKAADEAATRAAGAKPDTGGGSGREPGTATELQKMTGSEFKKRTAGMQRQSAEKEWQKIDAGQLEVDWTR